MIELIEKTLLTALGAATLSQKKTEEFLSELKQRFNVTETEGKQLLERLEQAAKENQQKLSEMAAAEVQSSCQRLGLVTRDEFDKLAKKVASLEKKLKSATG